jgi:hypothetical protein
MYSQVTAAVAARCEAGKFANPAAMVSFAETFADFYLGARRGTRPTPGCWSSAWSVADEQDLLVVQHLLLGINAHVNYDLPRAVVELADRTGSLSAIRADFDAINEVLFQTYRGFSRCLNRAARWTNAALVLGGERVFHFSLRRARQQAWEAAENLFVLDAAGRARYAAELDELVCVLAYLISQHRFPRSIVVPLLRRLEERDPRTVTAALLTRVA